MKTLCNHPHGEIPTDNLPLPGDPKTSSHQQDEERPPYKSALRLKTLSVQEDREHHIGGRKVLLLIISDRSTCRCVCSSRVHLHDNSALLFEKTAGAVIDLKRNEDYVKRRTKRKGTFSANFLKGLLE